MVGNKVFVYFNLHKKVFSVRDVKTGRVILHADRIILEDVKFKVSQSGRQRVLREKRKNVHAGVQGILKAYDVVVDPDKYPNEAYYNPYITETFINRQTCEPIQEAVEAYLVNKKVFYK